MESGITRRRADRRMLEVGVFRPFLLVTPVLATEGVTGDGSVGEVPVYKKQDVSTHSCLSYRNSFNCFNR